MKTLPRPLTLDSFEGIGTRRGTRGQTLVYLLSDDNGCVSDDNGCAKGRAVVPRLQRTLLLLFELDSGGGAQATKADLSSAGTGR